MISMMLLRRPISHLSSLSRISHSMKLHDSKDTRSNNCSFPHIPSAYSINNINEDNNDSFEINMNCYKKMETIRQNVLSAKAPEGSKKLSVFDRIKLLSDDGSPLLYLSTTAGLNLPYGSIRNAGTITAITRIMGKYCIISGNDWTFKGGTAFPISVKKQLRVHEIAMENRLPCIYLVDSGGAFLPLQADIYADKEHGGRSFRNEAVLSSMGIPQIAVVCGPCTAGGAYIPTMCDEAVIVKGSGSLYLGGPPLVKAATGESINSEELGGADVHCSISGCTDHYAPSEEYAMSLTRSIVESLNLSEQTTLSRHNTNDPLVTTSMEDMARLLPPDGEHNNWPVMEILARLLDGSVFHPFKGNFGCNLICGFSRLNGYLVGVLANNGLLDTTAAIKGTHFIRLCDIRNIPMIFLQNTPSDEEFLSPTGNGGTTAKARGEMMSTLSTVNVPKLTVIMGGSYGPSSFAMCGRAMSPNFLFTWPHARVGISSVDHLMKAMKIEKSDENYERLKQKYGEQLTSHSSYLVDDGMILPHETREVLSMCLEVCFAYPKVTRSRSNPVIRM